MASSSSLVLLLSLLASSMATSNATLDLRADLNHPYDGIPLSKHEMTRHAAQASKARLAWINARVAKACGHGTISTADPPVSPDGASGHTLTLSLGTPPQLHRLVLDTGSDLIWTQCTLFRHTARQREPLYDPDKSSSFAAAPCNNTLCETGFDAKNCSRNKCFYDYAYGSLATNGFLSYETFTFGAHHKASVRLAFGCGRVSSGTLGGSSGLIGVSPDELSLITQLRIPRFSYCLTPFADRKSSRIFFGAPADLSKYKTTGPIQSTPIVRNQALGRLYYYYVPMVGISVGAKRLDVPASSFAIQHDGSGGTFVDSGNTNGAIPAKAMEALKKALVKAVKLPVRNDTDETLCFKLPDGASMEAVQVPPLVYHFEDGAEMVLPRDNYLAELADGAMCLVMDAASPAVIGNYQQQNMHVLFDVQNQKFSFAPTQCDQI